MRAHLQYLLVLPSGSAPDPNPLEGLMLSTHTLQENICLTSFKTLKLCLVITLLLNSYFFKLRFTGLKILLYHGECNRSWRLASHSAIASKISLFSSVRSRTTSGIVKLFFILFSVLILNKTLNFILVSM
jgi:hypothetical protein